jgi:hypothetical protein
MLLGVVTLYAKPKYRIQSWVVGGTRMYLPQQKVWYRTNYFPLPFKIWVSGDYPFQNKEQAEEIIKNWSQSDIDIKKYKNTEFFYIK